MTTTMKALRRWNPDLGPASDPDAWEIINRPGASAYELARAAGYVGTLSEWLESLRATDSSGQEWPQAVRVGEQWEFRWRFAAPAPRWGRILWRLWSTDEDAPLLTLDSAGGIGMGASLDEGPYYLGSGITADDLRGDPTVVLTQVSAADTAGIPSGRYYMSWMGRRESQALRRFSPWLRPSQGRPAPTRTRRSRESGHKW